MSLEMSPKELKEIARKHNIEFDKAWSAEKMLQLLLENDVDLSPEASFSPSEPESPEVASEVPADLKKSWKELMDKFKALFKVKGKDKEFKARLQPLNQEKRNIKKAIEEKAGRRALRSVFAFERSRGLINSADEYQLNDWEERDCKGKAKCVQPLPSGRRTNLGQEVAFKKDFDTRTGEEMYVIYASRIVSPQEQISSELQLKRDLFPGYAAKEDEFAKPKRLVRRYSLIESEFAKYFEIEEDDEIEL